MNKDQTSNSMKFSSMELVYSPDDNGYYWQRYSDWATSQVFADIKQAYAARRAGMLEWGS